MDADAVIVAFGVGVFVAIAHRHFFDLVLETPVRIYLIALPLLRGAVRWHSYPELLAFTADRVRTTGYSAGRHGLLP